MFKHSKSACGGIDPEPNIKEKTMSQTQTPLGSGFGAASTALEVISGINLTGKTALVTGGSNGMGLEITRALVSAGANVVVPARNLEKARDALQTIERVELVPLDLMDPASIKAVADAFLASQRPLDILINNAGTMLNPLTRDGRGYESQLSTNHLGHFELAVRLWPALVKARGARVISVSSRTPLWSFRFRGP
jgi:NAD(P)-dependent dehydrogenase (short-subunit alcohol dehydrogenase family)